MINPCWECIYCAFRWSMMVILLIIAILILFLNGIAILLLVCWFFKWTNITTAFSSSNIFSFILAIRNMILNFISIRCTILPSLITILSFWKHNQIYYLFLLTFLLQMYLITNIALSISLLVFTNTIPMSILLLPLFQLALISLVILRLLCRSSIRICRIHVILMKKLLDNIIITYCINSFQFFLWFTMMKSSPHRGNSFFFSSTLSRLFISFIRSQCFQEQHSILFNSLLLIKIYHLLLLWTFTIISIIIKFTLFSSCIAINTSIPWSFSFKFLYKLSHFLINNRFNIRQR